MMLYYFMYYKKFYHNLKEDQIRKLIEKDGFDPIKIIDKAAFEYRPHNHPETKILAFLRGSMKLFIQDQEYFCEPGDKVIIPGNVEHSATVGAEGCEFFWSEKLL